MNERAPEPARFSGGSGVAERGRALIVHVDDVGMCLASIEAFIELSDLGTVTSGSLMAPCPWFPEAASRGAARPELDLGVHTTLTSEWSGYRWGPLSTRDASTGLIDAEGYFPHTAEALQQAASPEAVATELAAQVERVIAAGVDPTHIDTHMGAIAHERLIEAYIEQGISHTLPVMAPRPDAVGLESMLPDPEVRRRVAPRLASLEEQGMPLLDAIMALPLDDDRNQIETAKRLLGGLPAGITHFIIHASVDLPELRAIAPDWRGRVANYRVFRSDELRRFIESEGFELIGYRQLRDAMRRHFGNRSDGSAGGVGR